MDSRSTPHRILSLQLPCRVLLIMLGITHLCVPVRAAVPDTPAIDCVKLEGAEPIADDPSVLFYDDFEASQTLSGRYHDSNSGSGTFGVSNEQAFGGSTYALRQHYSQGQVNGGWAWRFFGDHPSLSDPDGSHYEEIYVRWYHKYAEGFEGFPPKTARLGSFARSDWTLAFMVHHWTSSTYIVADVAVNIPPGGDSPSRSGYNNFDHWLPVGRSTFSLNDNVGRWICNEMHVKLNTPGKSDGSYEYWTDGRSILKRTGRSLRESWAGTTINAMQWDTYWNSGSPANQARYYDNLIISTAPIGPTTVSRTPTVIKTPFSDPDAGDRQSAWQVQVASDARGDDVVWDSGTVESADQQMVIDGDTGGFQGTRSSKTELLSGGTYFLRIRQRDNGNGWSDWSTWQSPFRTPANQPARILSHIPSVTSFAADPGTQIDFSIAAEDAEGDSLTYQWTANDTLLSVDAAGSFSYRVGPALQQTVSVTVSDGETPTTLSWRIGTSYQGDLDADGDVDFGDFLLIVRAFGKPDAQADLDGDGTVSFSDFLILIRHYGLKRLG